MLIWLGKRLLHQRNEQPEINIEGAQQVTVRFVRPQQGGRIKLKVGPLKKGSNRYESPSACRPGNGSAA